MRRVVWVLVAALCCTALCVTAAATEESAATSSDIKARIPLQEAEVEKAMAAFEAEKKKEHSTNDAISRLKRTKDAAEMAVEFVDVIKENAGALSRNALAVFSVASSVSRAAFALKKTDAINPRS
ncbi:hypothetical protein DQ04_13961010 [Trypanosoma grayi]|uniref:hypothetical protein n=1 Tax=Trypanosoma grayi TaxID=71804 RepID=UPI0004F41F61|nr:hypothetical protein DQ04_13961010 [Trypanosoma grayi]KEG06431.1 hypothetical protein DQ04_13961010 [Trypanosoma grayi]